MKPKVDIQPDDLPPNMKGILETLVGIIDRLSPEKLSVDGTRIYRDKKRKLCVEVQPSSNQGIGVYLYVWSVDDIAVGVSHGAHEHFDRGYPGKDIAQCALDRFKALLYSEQITTIKSRKGKHYSWETVFYLDGKEITRLASTAFPTNPFVGKLQQKYTYSFL